MKQSSHEKTQRRIYRPSVSVRSSCFDLRSDKLSLPNKLEVIKQIDKGLAFALVTDVADRLGVEASNFLKLIRITGGTAHRRQRDRLLKPDESDRLYRVMRVTQLAERVLEDGEKARNWLKTPSRPLGGVTPLSLLGTDAGAEAVEEELYRIEYGVFA